MSTCWYIYRCLREHGNGCCFCKEDGFVVSYTGPWYDMMCGWYFCDGVGVRGYAVMLMVRGSCCLYHDPSLPSLWVNLAVSLSWSCGSSFTSLCHGPSLPRLWVNFAVSLSWPCGSSFPSLYYGPSLPSLWVNQTLRRTINEWISKINACCSKFHCLMDCLPSNFWQILNGDSVLGVSF